MSSPIWIKILIKSLAAVGCISTVLSYKVNNHLFEVAASDEDRYPCPAPKRSQTPWNHNWDNRAPQPCAESEISVKSSGCGDSCQVDAKATRTVKRNIFLIRHGHFRKSNGRLSHKGKLQALLTGERLENLGFKYNPILYTSTMTRARETSEIIKVMIPRLKIKQISKICEGIPFMPDPAPGHIPLEEKLKRDGDRTEMAFSKYFHRADDKQTRDSYELMVCHSNVIRYFVCRALQFTPDAWTRFSLHNCSITWLVIHPDGRVELKSLGDSEHLPEDLITT